jgi:hypothetical protein
MPGTLPAQRLLQLPAVPEGRAALAELAQRLAT